MKKTYIIIIVLVLIAGALFFILNSKKLEAPTLQDDNLGSASEETPDKSDNSGTVAVKEFTISGQNFSFSPSTIKVKKGDRVKITFKNTQGFHNFIIDEFGVATQQTQSPDTEVLEFTADKVGSFEYYCSVGTHRSMGMVGTLKVE